VYAIPCTQCRDIYVGQTGRDIKERLAEHERAVNKKMRSNALAKHSEDTGHKPNFQGVKNLYVEKNPAVRLMLEGLTIAINASRVCNISPPLKHMVGWAELVCDVVNEDV